MSFFIFYRHDFYDEVESLWKIRDPNITRVVGCCLSEEPFCLITEFMQYGDLNQFLQEHVAVTAAPIPPYAKTLRLYKLSIKCKILYKIEMTLDVLIIRRRILNRSQIFIFLLKMFDQTLFGLTGVRYHLYTIRSAT